MRQMVPRASPRVGDVLVQLGGHATGLVVPEATRTHERLDRYERRGRDRACLSARVTVVPVHDGCRFLTMAPGVPDATVKVVGATLPQGRPASTAAPGMLLMR